MPLGEKVEKAKTAISFMMLFNSLARLNLRPASLGKLRKPFPRR